MIQLLADRIRNFTFSVVESETSLFQMFHSFRRSTYQTWHKIKSANEFQNWNFKKLTKKNN